MAPQEAPQPCPHCGAVSEGATSHCPQCGTALGALPRMSFGRGCLNVLGGVFSGLLTPLALLLVLGVFANYVSNAGVAIAIGVVDLLLAALTVRVIWRARRGLTPTSLFLICLALTSAGALTVCSTIFLSFNGSGFH